MRPAAASITASKKHVNEGEKNILHDDCMCIHGNMNGCAVNNEFKAPFLCCCCLSDAVVTEVKKSWINADCYVLRAAVFLSSHRVI